MIAKALQYHLQMEGMFLCRAFELPRVRNDRDHISLDLESIRHRVEWRTRVSNKLFPSQSHGLFPERDSRFWLSSVDYQPNAREVFLKINKNGLRLLKTLPKRSKNRNTYQKVLDQYTAYLPTPHY